MLPVVPTSSIPSMIGEKLPTASKGLEAGLDTPPRWPPRAPSRCAQARAARAWHGRRMTSLELENGQGSPLRSPIIAKEVDKVNQIINNCIDALKLDSSSSWEWQWWWGPEMAFECQSLPAASTTSSTATPVPGVLSGPASFRPPYKEGSHHPPCAQLSADAAVARKTCSVSSSGSIKSAKVFSLDVPDHPATPGLAKGDSGHREGQPPQQPELTGPRWCRPAAAGVAAAGAAPAHHLR